MRDEGTSKGRGGVDGETFVALVEANKHRVFRVVLRFLEDEDLAREVTQAAFVQAYQKMSGFRREAAFGTWVYRIAINLCKNRLRESRRLVGLDSVVTGDPSIVAALGAGNPVKSAEEALADEEERRGVLDLVKTLPPKQRVTLELRVFGELSFEEIAKVVGCRVGTAKVNFHYAVAAIKRAIGERGAAE